EFPASSVAVTFTDRGPTAPVAGADTVTVCGARPGSESVAVAVSVAPDWFSTKCGFGDGHWIDGPVWSVCATAGPLGSWITPGVGSSSPAPLSVKDNVILKRPSPVGVMVAWSEKSSHCGL